MITRMAITAAIIAAAIGMMLIAGTNNGSFLTGFLWICAFLVLFLLPRPTDSEEDER
ncbi:MAG: hypothetical protein R6U37_05250 [Dehalococcoidia bacterium]